MVRTQIELGSITKHNIKMVKRLNQVIFPVTYNDQFYENLVKAGDFAKLAYYNDLPVGAVCCRPAPDSADGVKRLYIMTLGCLAPYRRCKLGSLMLEHVLELCEKEGFAAVQLHVQENNEAALEFYQKFGFKVMGKVDDYYKRIDPSSAYILEKQIEARPSSSN